MKLTYLIQTVILTTLAVSCAGIPLHPKKVQIKNYDLNATSGPINGYDYYNDKSPRVPNAAPQMKKEKTSKNGSPTKKASLKK